MRWLLAIVLLSLPTCAQAAYTLIQWDWAQGSGPAIDGFKVKCGRGSGTYSITITVADPSARSLDLYTATDGKGQWYCTVSAYTATDESLNGNEVNFVLPIPPFILSPNP